MAGFLRRKFTHESKPNPHNPIQIQNPIQNSSPNRQALPTTNNNITPMTPAPPPLFARFATTYQVPPASESKPAVRVVSAPMPLGPAGLNPTARRRAERDPDS